MRNFGKNCPVIWYLDTSAVNFFSQIMSFENAELTRKLQYSKDRFWCISPATVWELLANTDQAKRTEITDFALRLCHPKLLPSPEELIVNFIEGGIPKCEKYSQGMLESTSNIALTWDLHSKNEELYFKFDTKLLRDRFRALREVSRNMRKLIKQNRLLLKNCEVESLCTTVYLENIVNQIDLDVRERSNPDLISSIKTAAIYMLYILCAELGFDSSPIKRYWKKLGIDSISERVEYAISDLKELLWRGPFAQMAMVTNLQSRERFSRGVFLDSLHAMYLPYCNLFWTGDRGLLNLAKNQRFVHGHKLVDCTKAEITFHSLGKRLIRRRG